MNLVLTRDHFGTAHTLGVLTVDGKPFGFVCEDVDRHGGPKVHGQTAIPVGRYRVDRTFSNRFQVMMPILLGVPGFAGVRIHAGNTSAHTEGCLLPGLARDVVAGTVSKSKAAAAWLDTEIAKVIASGGEVWIEVKRA